MHIIMMRRSPVHRDILTQSSVRNWNNLYHPGEIFIHRNFYPNKLFQALPTTELRPFAVLCVVD